MCVKILNFENFSTFSKTFSTLILGPVFNDYVVFYGDMQFSECIKSNLIWVAK